MTKNFFDLHNRIAVLTGGLGLLGSNYTRALLDAGASVAVIDTATPATSAEEKFAAARAEHRILFFQTDITERTALEKVLEQLSAKWGTPDILINNAAIDSPPSAPASENGPFEEYPRELLDRLLSVNITGTFLCCQVFGGAMAKHGRGSVINISSIYGLVSPNQNVYAFRRRQGETWFKPAPYGLTKAAVVNLTKYLATYWAKQGVRVNALSPAGIANNQPAEFLEAYEQRVPLGRMAKPDEMNGAIIFLASDASSYMTGANLVVDGGFTAW